MQFLARLEAPALLITIAGYRGARGLADGLFPRRRLVRLFPLFRSGALPIELARRGFPDGLGRTAPSARPLERAVDQNRQQNHRSYDLQDREQRHRLDDASTPFLPGWWDLRPRRPLAFATERRLDSAD